MSTIARATFASAPTASVQYPIASRDAVTCDHCGLPVPAGLIDATQPQQFCCEGCRAVYKTITGCGLADYYRLRDAGLDDAGAAQPAKVSRGKFESFDSSAFESLYVTDAGDGVRQIELVLEGLTCGACVWLIERIPSVLPGVTESRLSLRDARVRIRWNPALVTLSRIAVLLDRFGYTPHPARSVTKQTLNTRRERTMLIDIAVAFALMGNMMLVAAALYAGWAGTMDPMMRSLFRWIGAALGIAALAGPGRCFFVNAWRSIRNRVANLDLPIALALVAGGGAGIVNTVLNREETYFDSLSMLVFLLLVGRYVQHRQQRRAEACVELLFNLMPSTVHIWRDGAWVDLPAEALDHGDRVEVRSNEVIPGDGVVCRGTSAIDQALLTGESMPTEIAVGDPVFGGAINRGGSIEVRIECTGRETRVGRLMELVERGLAEKPDAMRFADRIGRWFIPTVCLAAIGTFVYWSRVSVGLGVDNAIAMLIVTCPCILGLATPLTMSVAIGQLARRNILVKSAAALERLADVSTVVFDKTGTLTFGELRVVSYQGDARFKPWLVAIERTFEHPVARAIVTAFGDECLPHVVATDVTACGNAGVSGRIGDDRVLIGSAAFMIEQGIKVAAGALASDVRHVHAAVNGRVVVTITLGEHVRQDAAPAVQALSGLGVRCKLLSGDDAGAVRRVAQAVGIPAEAAAGDVTPEQKLAAIGVLRSVSAVRTLRTADATKAIASAPSARPRATGSAVAMIGDGVNDAAALAAADVGIAVHGGAEASLAAADIYIAAPGLAAVPTALAAARRTMCVVRRNFAITLFYNLVAATLAAGGWMNPLIAAILMPLSSATTLGFAVFAVRMRRETR